MRNKIYKIVLTIFCLYALFFLLSSIAVPILAHFECYELSAALDSFFMKACHRRPERVFWILGYPMSICARCIGFYAGVFISSFVCIFAKPKLSRDMLIVLISFILAEFLFNYFYIPAFEAAKSLRLIAGVALGVVFIRALSYFFEWTGRKKDEN